MCELSKVKQGVFIEYIWRCGVDAGLHVLIRTAREKTAKVCSLTSEILQHQILEQNDLGIYHFTIL